MEQLYNKKVAFDCMPSFRCLLSIRLLLTHIYLIIKIFVHLIFNAQKTEQKYSRLTDF